MQVLHAGRYSYHPLSATASRSKSPITLFTARGMSSREVRTTVHDFARAAALARQAGYDGIEVMGSEGYLINQFLTARVNRRDDEWGGSPQKRHRFATEIVRKSGPRSARTSSSSTACPCSTSSRTARTGTRPVALAKEIEAAGASIIDTGVGWHEARVPSIVTSVPRAAFSWITGKLRPEVSVPVIASNRINMPEVAG